MKITVDELNMTKEFPENAVFRDVADAFQPAAAHPILLCQSGTRLFELHKRVPNQNEELHVKLITTADKIGNTAYHRSAIFMMIKAFHSVCRDRQFDIIVDYTLGGGFYCYPKGDLELTAELLDKVKAKMQEYTARVIPIQKSSVSTEDAIRLFHSYGLYSKEELMKYRMTSRVNLYSIGKFQDYFYGYMVMDTSYIKLYDLRLYGTGFILLLPTLESPDKLPEFKPMDKLYEVQKHSSRWAERIGASNIGHLNDMIVQGRTDSLILMQEALFEKQIGNIAMRIATEHKRIVLIAGPSSSGKTTFSKRLAIQLGALGYTTHAISTDNYFRNRCEAPIGENGKPDFESIECVDLKQFNQDMKDLLNGKTVQLPHFNFITGEREYKGEFLKLGPDDVLVIEGIHCLNDRLSESLSDSEKFRIYISALTQLNVDEHNRIPTTDGRLLRRMVRDNRTRGYSALKTIAAWPSVRLGEERNIFPFQERADIMVNSSMIYELPVLKIYAQPLLFQIPREAEEYQEAKRLLKFLDYVLPISSERIPQNSIVREFIGGSCFDVG